MNANLKGMLEHHTSNGKTLNGLVVTDKGKKLTHEECFNFINYCISKGCVTLYDCPEYEDIENELK